MSEANKPAVPRRKRVITKKNHTHQVSHLFPFPNQNESVFFISNINLHPDPNAPADMANEQNSLKLDDMKIETRTFPVLTKSNGFPRIIQEIKLNLGNKVLTLTNMTTNLKPSAMNDEYFSQIMSTLTPHNVINEYKINTIEEEQPVQVDKVALSVNNFSNINLARKNSESDIKPPEEKIYDLSNTLVNSNQEKPQSNEENNEKEENEKKLFTIKKKISKPKNNEIY